MRTKIHDGSRLDFIAPRDIHVDEPVLIGNIFGISFNTVKAGDLVAIEVVGVHELDKDPALVFKMGDDAYFHKVKKQIVNAPDGQKTHPVGYITSNEEQDSAKCFVRLTPGSEGLNDRRYLVVTAAADTDAGEAVVAGDIFGVATHGAKAGLSLQLKVEGTEDLPKEAATTANFGVKAWFHKTNKAVVAVADAGNTLEIGYFVAPALADETTCKVRFSI